MRGITVTNYLVFGDPEGIVLSYISNWSGQAIKIPRNTFQDIAEFSEVKKPGIYFLFGSNPDNPDDKWVYVGEANNLFDRLKQHLADDTKSFFDTVVCFSSKDENLTVSHTKYLEKISIEHVAKNSVYKLLNGNGGTGVSLSRMLQDEMQTFFENMQVLLPTVGFSLFNNNLKSSDQFSSSTSTIVKLNLKVGGIVANAVLNPNSFEVISGSQVNPNVNDSLSDGYKSLRATLIERGILGSDNGKLKFLENYEFTSSSAAATIIVGYPINGRTNWKTSDGKTLKEYEQKLVSD